MSCRKVRLGWKGPRAGLLLLLLLGWKGPRAGFRSVLGLLLLQRRVHLPRWLRSQGIAHTPHARQGTHYTRAHTHCTLHALHALHALHPHVPTCAHIHTSTHACTCKRARACACLHVRACTCVRVCVHVRACMCACARAYFSNGEYICLGGSDRTVLRTRARTHTMPVHVCACVHESWVEWGKVTL